MDRVAPFGFGGGVGQEKRGYPMSLDMTMGTGAVIAPTAADEAQPAVRISPAMRLWLQDVLLGTVTSVAVVLSSTASVFLFLR